MKARTIVVRVAVPTDRDFVFSLAGRFAETRPAWRTEREVTAGTNRALTRAFDAPHANEVVFVAEDAGVPVAFAYAIEERDFFTGEPHAHLSEIAAVRGGTGAGRALVAAVETWAARRGSRYVSLHVNAANTGACALYKSAGYDVEYYHMTKQLHEA